MSEERESSRRSTEESSRRNTEETKVREVKRDVDKLFDRVRDLEEDLAAERQSRGQVQDDVREVGKLAVFTARSAQKSESQYKLVGFLTCLLYTSPSPRDATLSRMPSSA